MAAIEELSPEAVGRDMDIGTGDLSSHMTNQAALYARYAYIVADCHRKMSSAKIAKEIEYTKADRRVRDRLMAESTDKKKPTEAQISVEVNRDHDYIRAIFKFSEAETTYELARNLLEGLKQRRDMLVQLGVAQREEIKGDLYIRGLDDKKARALGVIDGKTPG